MIELFLNLSKRAVGHMQPGQWNYIEQGLKRNIEKVQQYYRTWNPILPSNHFLVRLLQTLSVPYSLSLDRYVANVDRVALGHAMQLGMTSVMSKGRVFRGAFYGAATPEILLAVDDSFNYEEADRNWKNVCAVKPLLHAKTDTDLLLPNGLYTSDESGLTIVQINITLLAVQYRAFLRSQAGVAPGTAKTDASFIGAYVLPNMLPAHMEQVLFNRLYALHTSPMRTPPKRRRSHPFSMPRYDAYLDNALAKSLEYIDTGKLEFETMLKSMPSVSYASQYEAQEMPDILPTRQVDWALTAARLKAVDLLVRLGGEFPTVPNQRHFNQIERALVRNDAWKLMQENLPGDALRDLTLYVEHLQERNGRDFV